ncbi:MAG: LysR family transcriptional regulator [Pseudomonadales bacterium]|nr:LysR family transcriptional regulator [Pseudomonadales bacterium]
MNDISWSLLRYALMTVRKGSASGAAAELGVTHATILRGLKRLEKETGVKLFNKSHSGYSPTEQGHQLIELADNIESQIFHWLQNIESEEPTMSGELRVATTEILANGLVCPLLPKFYEKYPNIRLDIKTSYEFCNLTRYEADIALRSTNEPPEHLVGRHLSNITWAVYQSVTLSTTLDHWVGFIDDSLPPAKWLKSLYPDAQIRYKASSILNQIEATKAGVGKALLPCFLADQEPLLKQLEKLDQKYCTQLWLLYNPESRHNKKVRAFVEWIRERIQQEYI